MTNHEDPLSSDPEDDIIRQERTQWLDPIVIVSGGFDPVHEGHMALFNAAAEYGKVHVFLNSDDWLARKKGSSLLSFQTRKEILKNMTAIHRVHSVDDRDDSVCNGLLKLRGEYSNTKMFFANDGDRRDNIPEMWFCEDLEIELLWNVGGDKIDSSSKLRRGWEQKYIKKSRITHRNWGDYEIIGSGEGWLAKILTIEPGKSISLQRHTYRAEEWLILEGYGEFSDNHYHHSEQDFFDPVHEGQMALFNSVTRVYPGLKITVPKLTWHKVKNTEKTIPLLILEAWFGEVLEESDIERKENESEIVIPE